MAHQLVPVLDQVGPAGVQETDVRIGVDRRALGQGPVQLRDVAAVEPVGGVREQQVAAGLQHRLHPPAQPVPGVHGAAVRAALLAETVAVPVHLQQRGGGVRPQRVQPEPGVRHAGVEADRDAELLLGLGVGAHGVGVDSPHPGEVGGGAGMLCAEVHQVPTSPFPPVPPAVRRSNQVTRSGSWCQVSTAFAGRRTRWHGTRASLAGRRATRVVTVGERSAAVRGRITGWQNEAPGHGEQPGASRTRCGRR